MGLRRKQRHLRAPAIQSDGAADGRPTLGKAARLYSGVSLSTVESLLTVESLSTVESRRLPLGTRGAEQPLIVLARSARVGATAPWPAHWC